MKFLKFSFIIVVLFASVFVSHAQNTKYKCLVQMNSYQGDAAYVVISLLNSTNNYEKTLYILGSDKKWYNTLKEWYKFYNKKSPLILVRLLELLFLVVIVL